MVQRDMPAQGNTVQGDMVQKDMSAQGDVV
jgi:hypothetical protein